VREHINWGVEFLKVLTVCVVLIGLVSLIGNAAAEAFIEDCKMTGVTRFNDTVIECRVRPEPPKGETP
jgi:hypothetical protein